MPDERTLRLFVACPLPDGVKRGLGQIQDDLRRAGFETLRYVRPEGIHITLKFLGSVDADRVDAIADALGRAVEPFELRLGLDRLGGFPSTSLRAGSGERLRVVWVGPTGDVAQLAALAERVEDALAPLGFPREGRPFAAHLTLARVPDQASPEERRRLAQSVQQYAFISLPPMILKEAHLMRSILGPGGSKYEQLVSFPGKGGRKA
jgi:RNA 2',3'-cyclic 3'-phosphodiesterase